MKHLIRLFVSLLVPALMLAFATATPAMKHEMAQDKMKDAKAAKAETGKAVIKVLFENDKVRVVEATLKPGDEAANVARPFHVIRPLKGGTIQRTFADGKTDKIEFKTGEVKALEASAPHTPKNVGKSDVVLYVVFVKEPKK
jgi:mannose-6-phosphate isomerase-like protein (cupin superfamily)